MAGDEDAGTGSAGEDRPVSATQEGTRMRESREIERSDHGLVGSGGPAEDSGNDAGRDDS